MQKKEDKGRNEKKDNKIEKRMKEKTKGEEYY